MTTFQKSIVGIGIVIIVLLGVIAYGLFRGAPEEVVSQSQESAIVQESTMDDISATNKPSVEEEDESVSDLEKYEYYLSDVFINHNLNVEHPVEVAREIMKEDRKLLRRDRDTGKEEVVIESVKAAIPEFYSTNLSLKDFAHPKTGNQVFFASIVLGTDNPASTLYSFNVNTKKFTKMSINYGGWFGGDIISPDKTKFVWVDDSDMEGDNKTLYVADLMNDSVSILVELSKDETFNAGKYGMSAYFDIEWVDGTTIRYAVYDQAKKEDGYTQLTDEKLKERLIEYREVKL